jgi:hypothetical protein
MGQLTSIRKYLSLPVNTALVLTVAVVEERETRDNSRTFPRPASPINSRNPSQKNQLNFPVNRRCKPLNRRRIANQ